MVKAAEAALDVQYYHLCWCIHCSSWDKMGGFPGRLSSRLEVLSWGTQEQAEKQQAKGAKGHGEEAKDVDGAEAEEVPGGEARAGDDGAKAIQIGCDGMFSTADYFHQSNDCDNDGGNGAKKEKPAPHHNECGDAPHDEQRGVNKGPHDEAVHKGQTS